MSEIVLLGSGGHAKVVLDIIRKMSKYKILGVVTKQKIKNFEGIKVLGDDGILNELYKSGIRCLAMGIGGFRDNETRKTVFLKSKKLGFNFISAIDTSAIISNSVVLGEGVVLFPGVLLNTDVRIGDNVIIATGSSIDHETIIRNHALVSAGVTIGANCVIDDEALVALGANIVSGIHICEKALVGAGATVVKDIEEKGLYLGCPAKKKMQS